MFSFLSNLKSLVKMYYLLKLYQQGGVPQLQRIIRQAGLIDVPLNPVGIAEGIMVYVLSFLFEDLSLNLADFTFLETVVNNQGMFEKIAMCFVYVPAVLVVVLCV